MTHDEFQGGLLAGMADAHCEMAGTVYDAERTWRALISTGESHAHAAEFDGPVFSHGCENLIADSHAELWGADGAAFDAVPDVDEHGHALVGKAWTGSDFTGTRLKTCGGWTNPDGEATVGTIGDPTCWFWDGTLGCGAVAHLYCIGSR